MVLASLFDSEIFTWVVLPLLIFLARVIDVSLQTLRIIFISKGKKLLAPIVGFFEVLIWLLAIGQVMRNLTNIPCYLAYGGGFAMGNYVGLIIEEKLAVGIVLLRVITQEDPSSLLEHLRKKNYGVTNITGQGGRGKVSILMTVIRRLDVRNIAEEIMKFNPNAFYTIEDVRHVSSGIFPLYARHHL
ncbi:MAG: DUF2179 domain-containing protein [Acidobacteria bacterium]|nr:DUF2179 domain-containing protein [Acidobacteriota bacterium]